MAVANSVWESTCAKHAGLRRRFRKRGHLIWKMHPVMLVFCPDRPRRRNKGRIGKAANGDPDMIGPHIRGPVNCSATVRAESVAQTAPRLSNPGKTVCFAFNGNDACLRIISADTKRAAGPALTFGAIAGDDDIRVPLRCHTKGPANA